LSNPETTPFNIGQRIDLKDFTFQQSGALASGLGKTPKVADALVRRILHWTGGQPYLTQTLCKAVAQDESAQSVPDVDRICRDLILTPGNDPTVDEHYQQVSDRILKREKFRKDNLTLYANLIRYRRLRKQFGPLSRILFDEKLVADDDTRSAVNGLKLAGLARSQNGYLRIRNEIYAQRFDEAWIDRHLQGPEQRAQREAYLRGLRYAALAVVSVVSLLALVAASFIIARMNESQRRTAVLVSKQNALLSENTSYAARLTGALTEATHARDLLSENVKDLKKARDLEEAAKNKAAWLAVSAREAAERERSLKQVALENERKAEDVARQNQALKDTPEKEAKKYAELEKEASAGKMALQATLLQKDSPASLPESLSTGIESMAHFPTLFADQAIRSVLDLLPKKVNTVPAPGTRPWHSSSADGHFFVRVDTSQNVQYIFHRWDVEHPSKPDDVAFDNTGAATAVDAAISPDGNYLAVFVRDLRNPSLGPSSNLRVEIRSWGNAHPPATSFRSPPCGTSAVVFAGPILASMPCTGRNLELLDLRSGALRSLAINQPNFSPYSTVFLAGDKNGKYVLERRLDGSRTTNRELVRIWGIELQPGAHAGNQQKTKTKFDTPLATTTAIAFDSALFDPSNRFVAFWQRSKIQVWNFGAGFSHEINLPDNVLVSDVTFNKRGTLLSVASSDNAAIIYDPESGMEVKRLSHSSAVKKVRFSYDDLRLATASSDKTARVWNLSTGRELARVPLAGDAQEVAFASNDTTLVALSEDPNSAAVIWQSSAASGGQSWAPPAGTNFVTFDPKSSHLITAILKTHVRESSATIYQTGQWQRPQARIFLGSPTDTVLVGRGGVLATIGTAVLPTSGVLQTQSVLQTWDIQSGSRLWPSRLSHFRSLAKFSNSGRLIAGISGVLELSVTNAANGSRIVSNPLQLPDWNSREDAPLDYSFQFAFDPAESRLLFTSASSSFCGLNEWAFKEGSSVKTLISCNSKASSQMSDDGSRFLVEKQDGLSVYDSGGHHLLTYKTLKPLGTMRALSRDGKFLANDWAVFDLTSSSAPVTNLPIEAGTPVIFTAKLRYLVTNSRSHGVELLDLSSHRFIPLSKGDKTEVDVLGDDLEERYLAMTIRGTQATPGSPATDNVVCVYDLNNLSAPPQQLPKFSQMAFSPDGGTAVGLREEGNPTFAEPPSEKAAVIWWKPDAADRAFTYEQNGVSAVAISPDGNLIATEGPLDGKLGDEQLTVSAIKRDGFGISTAPVNSIRLNHGANWVAFSPESSHLALTAGNILVTVPSTSGAKPTSRRFLDRIVSAAFARTQPLLAFSTDHRLEMLDLSTSRNFEPVVYGDSDSVLRIAMDDTNLAVATRTNAGCL
jgi:WD40 repeat protein